MKEMKMLKVLMMIVILLSSFILILPMLEDGAMVLPAWIYAYRLYFFYIWLIAMTFGLVMLL